VMFGITQAARDEYPFSHYPMYSQPSTRPLLFPYVADAQGQPLPISSHTGITPSQVGKKFGRTHVIMLEEAEERTGRDMDDLEKDPQANAEIKRAAAEVTLKFLRAQSLKRKAERHLKGELQLIEVALSFGDGAFRETKETIATLPAIP
jgi:hypothetical protein